MLVLPDAHSSGLWHDLGTPAQAFNRDNECHGWLGVKMQPNPRCVHGNTVAWRMGHP